MNTFDCTDSGCWEHILINGIMKHPLYQVDAFTDTIFGGNPACVVPLEKWLSDNILLKIAKENAVAETAFFVAKGEKIKGLAIMG
jgi:PhzF family phenazine biosynthesis protein